MDKIVYSENNLTFELDKINLTATIINGRDTFGDVFVPRSVSFCSQDYIITKIAKESFAANSEIKSINFTKDSELLSIGRNAFSYSALESLHIPSKFTFFDENWCLNSNLLNTINISSENKNFKYLDDTKKIILGKSDPNVDNFDSLVFISRDIKEITIPSTIKQICSCSFPKKNITVKFEGKCSLEIIQKDSIDFKEKFFQVPPTVKYISQIGSLPSSIFRELISPDNPHFKYIDDSMLVGKSDPNEDEFDCLLSADLNIEKAVIPSTIKYIKNYCFNKCRKLKTVEFQPNSQLISIEGNSFNLTSIEEIKIPSSCQIFEQVDFTKINPNLKLIEFADDSQIKELYLPILGNQTKLTIPKSVEKIHKGILSFNFNNISISPDHHNISFLDNDHKIIVGKSDPESDVFDVIMAASSDINSAFIPSTITRIDDYSFSNCNLLFKIDFAEDIQLKSIGKYAFNKSSISRINIPSSVIEISSFCFSNCSYLNTVNISEDSKLEIVDKNAFVMSGINQLFIPSKVKEFSFIFNFCIPRRFVINNINHVEISPENNHFKYLDEEKKIIVRKSNFLSDDFDTIVFASNDIKKIFITSNIKYINEGAFLACNQLTEVKFDKNSQLISIGAFAFSRTGIIEMIIPSNVKDIGDGCFSNCLNLEKIDFEPNSELTYFKKLLFYKTPIKFLTFPSSLKYLLNDWCFEVKKLNNVFLKPENKNFVYFDDSHKMIFKKSKDDLDTFDELVFACRNCMNIKIPSYIKKIGTCVFSDTNIKSISIPKNVICIDSHAFMSCNKVLSIEFEKIKSFDFTRINYNGVDLFAMNQTNLISVEFLGDDVFVSNHVSFKNYVISFPNAHKIQMEFVFSNTTIFTCPKAEFIFQL